MLESVTQSVHVDDSIQMFVTDSFQHTDFVTNALNPSLSYIY